MLKGAAEYRSHLLEQISAGQLPIVADLAYRLVQHNIENRRNVTVLVHKTAPTSWSPGSTAT